MHRSAKFVSLLMVLVLAIVALPTSSVLAAPDTTAPVVSDLALTPTPVVFNTPTTLTAKVDDTTTGGSNIASADYSLDGVTWVAMTAQDGAFDAPTEIVTATFTPTKFGANKVYVRAKDAAGNATVDPQAFLDFTVADTVPPVVSNVAVTPNPVPLNTMAAVTATVDDTTTGGSNIKSAEFSLNGGPWTAMTAVDGAFDAVMENVTASFKGVKVGDNTVCVRGTDVPGNTSLGVCNTFKVVYIFKGFFAPVRMNVVNMANTPRTIPLKWQLLDGNNKPISSKASFVAVKSYQVDCTTLQGDASTAVLEKSPGNSGLKYQGRGFWHFNWKTSKAYRHSCRAMFVLFNSGQTSPVVVFNFR